MNNSAFGIHSSTSLQSGIGAATRKPMNGSYKPCATELFIRVSIFFTQSPGWDSSSSGIRSQVPLQSTTRRKNNEHDKKEDEINTLEDPYNEMQPSILFSWRDSFGFSIPRLNRLSILNLQSQTKARRRVSVPCLRWYIYKGKTIFLGAMAITRFTFTRRSLWP